MDEQAKKELKKFSINKSIEVLGKYGNEIHPYEFIHLAETIYAYLISDSLDEARIFLNSEKV